MIVYKLALGLGSGRPSRKATTKTVAAGWLWQREFRVAIIAACLLLWYAPISAEDAAQAPESFPAPPVFVSNPFSQDNRAFVRANRPNSETSDAADLPKIDCSTSARPLRNLIWARMLNIELSWQPGLENYTELDFMRRERHLVPAEPEGLTNSQLFHQSSGTHGAYMSIATGGSDLALIARLPTHLEYDLARQAGITFEVFPVAWDALVFIASSQSPVDNVSTDNLRKVFGGEVTCWSELGSPEKKPIALGWRNPQSGSQELLLTYLMGGRALHEPEFSVLMMSMMGPFDTIARDVRIISFTVFYYQDRMMPVKGVKRLAVDGVAPSAATIADGSYPYITPVYAVTRKGEPNGEIVGLRDWLLSPEGQKLVAASGYVPLLPTPATASQQGQ